jgi:hypothetical protein
LQFVKFIANKSDVTTSPGESSKHTKEVIKIRQLAKINLQFIKFIAINNSVQPGKSAYRSQTQAEIMWGLANNGCQKINNQITRTEEEEPK